MFPGFYSLATTSLSLSLFFSCFCLSPSFRAESTERGISLGVFLGFSLFAVFFTVDDVMDGAFDEGGALEQLAMRYFEDLYFENIWSDEYRGVL
jgi:hypothetical protein